MGQNTFMDYHSDFKQRFPLLVESLGRAARNGRLAHAYLIHGDQAETRAAFAVFVAQTAVCPETAKTGFPCGTCRECRRLADGSHPELHTLRPEGKAFQIKVGDVTRPEVNTARWFEEQFYLTSTGTAGKKIGIIYEAERMNEEAQNAFLKTLEEPPPATLFLLLTGHPEHLLPTTRSRCQTLPVLENRARFDFPGAPELFGIFHRVFFEAPGDLALAVTLVDRVMALAAELKELEEARVGKSWETRIEQAKEFDPSLAKRLTEQAGDAAVGEYRWVRDKFLSATHTFFAQLYALSCGTPRELLPNPELFEGLDIPAAIDEKRAQNAVEACDKLLYHLRFNVLEDLAWRNWVLQITRRDH